MKTSNAALPLLLSDIPTQTLSSQTLSSHHRLPPLPPLTRSYQVRLRRVLSVVSITSKQPINGLTMDPGLSMTLRCVLRESNEYQSMWPADAILAGRGRGK